MTIAVLIKESISNGGFLSNLYYASLIILSQLVGATMGVTFVGLTLTTVNGHNESWKTPNGIGLLCPPISEPTDVSVERLNNNYEHCDP